MAKTFVDVADFLIIYIAEAHASDEWPLGKCTDICQHKTKKERLKAANYFCTSRQCEIPILVDTMINEFDLTYAAWPERFYIINNGLMEFIGMPSTDDQGYSRPEISYWLKRNTKMLKNQS